MTERLTRRRFTHLALVGGVAATSIGVVTAPFATTIFARSVNLGLIGVSAGPLPGGADASEVAWTEFESASSSAATASEPLSIVLQTFDLTAGRPRSLVAPRLLRDGQTPVLRSNEAVTGCTVLKDGTVVLAITPVSASKNEREPTRLVALSAPATMVAIAGLKRNEQLGDLVATADGRLLGLVSSRGGAAPATLVAIDLSTGRLSAPQAIHLPGYWRISTLVESPTGELYATAITPDGDTHLVELGAGGKQTFARAALSLDGSVWNNGLRSLVYSTADLIAFGARRYETVNALYSVDARSGAMTRLHDFDVVSVAFSHT
jgi:hypothetical protein